MKSLKRIRYDTMNSWNGATAPAYNLKVYNVVDSDLTSKVYEMMESEDFYDDINWLVQQFGKQFDYEWQAGFNGRSGGYLVLYKGGRRLSEHKSHCTHCWQRNFTTVEASGNICGKCGNPTRINKEFWDVYTMPGQSIEDDEVPADVKKAFRQLAIDIVKDTEYKARNFEVVEEEYQVTNTRKVLVEKG